MPAIAVASPPYSCWFERMCRIWLHIGLPKTGSTAAQVELYHLDDAHLRYARLLPNTDHNAVLASAAAGDPAAVAQLEAELARDDRDVILSSEALAQAPHHAAPLLTLLQRHARQVTVLCTVRNPVDHLPSLFIHRLPEELAGVRDSIRRSGPWRPYGSFTLYHALAAWTRRCEADGFVLVDYDDPTASSPAAGLLVRMDRPDVCRAGDRINGSLTMDAVSVLAALIADADLARSQALFLLWGRLLRSFGRERLRFDPAILRAALSESGAPIAMIESRLGRSLSLEIAAADSAVISHLEELVLTGRRNIEPFCEHLRQAWHWSVPALTTPPAFLAWLTDHLATLTQLETAPDYFDPQRYLRINPDVAASAMDPTEHYRKYGFHQQRQI